MQVNELTAATVPTITISGGRASSDAARPRHLADNCACWPDADRKAARKLLAAGKSIECADATAQAAVTAVGMELLMEGRTVSLKQIKAAYLPGTSEATQ